MGLLIVPGNGTSPPSSTLRIPRDAYDPLRDRAVEMGVTEDSFLKMILYTQTMSLVNELREYDESDAGHALDELSGLIKSLPAEAFYEVQIALPGQVLEGLTMLADHYTTTISTLATLFVSLHFMVEMSDDELDEMGIEPNDAEPE
jgi:hypothetical protein